MMEDKLTATLPKYRVLDSNIIENRTRCGNHRYKYAIRAGFRAVSLISLVAVFCVYNYFQAEDAAESLAGRRLSATGGDMHMQERSLEGIFPDEADPKWHLVWYILGILYLFLAIAIVCDEFFVPALEVMVDEDHLNMSRDIAGATLMAAGGSAPELFTSIIGTFQKSEIGFGTIVGSAVFNVLFVIGMCSIFSTEVLQLSWWPLFRDCSYYVMSLLVLGVFVGVVTDGEIQLWEAIVLFALYLGYVIVMAFNEKLHILITGKELNKEEENPEEKTSNNISFQYPHTFRAGLLTFIKDKENWQAKARLGFLYGISGNFDDVFSRVDLNGDGNIDKEEMANCFRELGTPTTDNELEAIMEDIDDDGDKKVSKAEFKKWYLSSEENMKTRVREVFNTFDSDSSGTLVKSEFVCLLQKVDPSADQQYKDESAAALFDAEKRTALSFEEFTEWYFNSLLFTQQRMNIDSAEEEGDDGLCEVLCPPKDGSMFDYLKWAILFPIVASLSLTVPNTARPHLAKWCYLSFFLSIAWIGIYSYFMVGFAATVGKTVGIPDFIMGLTFLAAGTSVPDLLSSVIVARMGEGDMAVSSSIGSNIFDILVGLPLPWLLYIIYSGEDVIIGTEGIWVSIMILIGMIILIIGAIHFQGWKLTKTLAYIMFFFYFAFLVQAVLNNYL